MGKKGKGNRGGDAESEPVRLHVSCPAPRLGVARARSNANIPRRVFSPTSRLASAARPTDATRLVADAR